MRRRGFCWAVAVGLVVGTASLTAAASPSLRSPASVADRAQRVSPTFEPDRTPQERAIFEMVEAVNVERGNQGLPPLQLDTRVTAAAQAHAVEMMTLRRMQHVGADGSDGGVRLNRAGYTWELWGENIGAGFFAPVTLFETWMNSESHRANLLGNFTDIGVGVAATEDGVPYWSVLVARAPYIPGQL